MYCYRNILFQGLLHVKRGTLKCSILSHNLTSRQFIKIMFPSIATMATTNKHKRMLLYSINYFADIAFITTQEVFFPPVITFDIYDIHFHGHSICSRGNDWLAWGLLLILDPKFIIHVFWYSRNNRQRCKTP